MLGMSASDYYMDKRHDKLLVSVKRWNDESMSRHRKCREIYFTWQMIITIVQGGKIQDLEKYSTML